MANQHGKKEDAPLHYEDGVPIFDPPPHTPDGQRRAKEKEDKTYNDRQISIQEGMLKTQVALVFFGIISLGVTAWQGHLANRAAKAAESAAGTAQSTLRELQHGSGAQDTHTLAQEAVTQANQTTAFANHTEALAEAAGRQASASQTLADYTKLQADAARIAAAAARDQVDAFKRATADSASTQIAASLPVVTTVSNVLIGQRIKGEWQYRAIQSFTNSGDTRAVDPEVRWGRGSQPPVASTVFQFHPRAWERSTWVKGTVVGDSEIVPTEVLSKSAYHDYPLYVYGRVSYKDIFPQIVNGRRRRNDHIVEFCIQITKVNLNDSQIGWAGADVPDGYCFDSSCPDYQKQERSPEPTRPASISTRRIVLRPRPLTNSPVQAGAFDKDPCTQPGELNRCGLS